MGRTYTAICGVVSMSHEGACLANFLAIGEPRGAGAGEWAAFLVGVFSLEGRGLAVCEDRWPRPLLGGRRPRSDFDSQLTIVWKVGTGCCAGKKDETVGQLQGEPIRQSVSCKRACAVELARWRLSYGRFFKTRRFEKRAAV